jgi:hypothetical protein
MPPTNRLRPRRGALSLLLVALAVLSVVLAASELRKETLEAWNAYVAATERRIEREVTDPRRFLALDFQPAPREAEERREVLAGEVVATSVKTRDANDREIDVPHGTIQHWRADILVPGVSIDVVEAALRSGATLEGQPEVLEARILARDGDTMRVYLKVRKKSLVTVTYLTEHESVVRRLAPDRLVSRSVATRIVELEDAGTSRERPKPEGEDHGYLWRLNSYWRYQSAPGGVIIELESLTLSRDIPLVLVPIASPIVNRIARESLKQTLVSLRDQLVTRGR